MFSRTRLWTTQAPRQPSAPVTKNRSSAIIFARVLLLSQSSGCWRVAADSSIISVSWYPTTDGPFVNSVGRFGRIPDFGVGTVWRGIGASGGWRCLPSLGETQYRRQAWQYGGVRQLGRVRGQAHGRHVRGSDGTGGTRSGWTRWIRHLLRISTPGRRRMLLGGALRGRSPRTREGRLGPTARNCSDQWLVVSGQRRRFFCWKREWEVTVAGLPSKADCSPLFWDAPGRFEFTSDNV